MDAVFTYEVTVGREAIDGNGHANNVEYVRWMQEAAVAHSDASGCTAATMAAGCTWVVHRHGIEYRRPALEGDVLEVRTWVVDFRRIASLRRYAFVRRRDGQELAAGETDWVFVDVKTGRPTRVPEEVQRCFVLVP